MSPAASGSAIGVNSVLFRHHDLATAAAEAARAGYDGVELAAIAGMCEHLRLDSWRDQLGELEELGGRHGLEWLSIEVGSPRPERVGPALEAAAHLGIPVVNVGPGGKADDAEELREAIEGLSALAKMAESSGVLLGVKAHVGAAVHDTPTTEALLESVPSRALCIDVDPSHLYRAGEEPSEAFVRVAGRVGHVHVRDCPAGSGGPGNIAQQTCGRGDIDLLGFCDTLVASAYRGPICLEVIGASADDPLASLVQVAAESRGYLRAAFEAARRGAEPPTGDSRAARAPLGGADEVGGR